MATEITSTLTALVTKVSGSKTNNTDMGKKFGLITLAMRAVIKMVKSMGTANFCGQTTQLTKETSSTTTFTETAFINGPMAARLTGSGSLIKCMAEESLLGTTVEDTKVNTLTTRKKVMAFSHGQTDVSTMASGLTANSMEMVCTHRARESLRRDSGTKVNE